MNITVIMSMIDDDMMQVVPLYTKRGARLK